MFIDLLIKGLKRYINYVYNYANFSGDLGMGMGSVITVNETVAYQHYHEPGADKEGGGVSKLPGLSGTPKDTLASSPVDSGGDKQTLHIHMNPLSGKNMT